MADPEAIYNWRRLDERITTSGQPTEPQLADIHALGVRHVAKLVKVAISRVLEIDRDVDVPHTETVDGSPLRALSQSALMEKSSPQRSR